MNRIAVLSYDYPPNDGGISRLVCAAVGELARRGRGVEVLTLATDGRTGPSRPTVPTREVPSGGLRRDLATFGYLRSLAADALVLTTVWNPEATLAWLARRTHLTVMAHGNEVMPYPVGRTWGLKDRLRRRILGAAHAVVCNSRYTERLVRDLNPGARTAIICPAVDATRFGGRHDAPATRTHFGLPTGKRLILSVSRLDAYKGHDVMLRALAQLPREARSRLHYAVAGRGSHLHVLQRLASELGISDCVSWLRFVADEALPELYASADLFALCTREDPQARGVEGFGMVFLEAQAAGVAVLGTKAGGIPDAIVEGEGGWLVPQDDVAAVAAHLERLARDVAPFQQQGALGRERVCRDATWEKYVDRLLAIMEARDV
jgi:phosphatidylinositol alpha-1,6-mannosyltransferase